MNVTSEDNGFTLTCIAENVVGMSNASVALTVHCEWAPLRGPAVARGDAPVGGRGGPVCWQGQGDLSGRTEAVSPGLGAPERVPRPS